MGQQKKSDHIEFILKLFISGASPNSIKAINNLKAICETHMKSRYTLEIIDVYQDGALAQKEQIIALPMLIRKFPLPERKLIGDMSNTQKVLNGLGVNEP
jgi:circadian clock protein KaiB